MRLRFAIWCALVAMMLGVGAAAAPAKSPAKNKGSAQAAPAAGTSKTPAGKPPKTGKATVSFGGDQGKGDKAKKSGSVRPTPSASTTPGKPSRKGVGQKAKTATKKRTATKQGTATKNGGASGVKKGAAPKKKGSAVSARSAGSGKKSQAEAERRQAEAATYAVRLRDLESRVDELKEQIRRSHTRLTLLSDTILSGGVGGAHVELAFRNELSNAFRVTSLMFVLDGSVQYKKEDASGALSNQKEIPIFSGPIPPGDHTVQVVVGMRGHGYGVFSYLKAYKPTVKRTHSFTVDEGKSARVEVILWEKGSATTPVEERPALRFVQKVRDRSEALVPEGQ